MTEKSYYWGGTITGDASLAPYDDDEFSDNWNFLLAYDRVTQGVISTARSSYTGFLNVTNPAGTTVRVATGAALVDGKLYTNDANIDFSAATANQYYTVVLRKSWSGQTVRAALLGPQVGSPPSVTQTDGTTWEISLATVYNNAGTLEITDARSYTPRRRYVQMFVPCVGGVDSGATSLAINSTWGGFTMAGTLRAWAMGHFILPDDYVSGLTITPVLTMDSGSFTWDIYWQTLVIYGICGETLSLPTESSGYATYTSSGALEEKMTCFTAFSPVSVARGDIINVQFERHGAHASDTYDGVVYFRGWRIQYQSRL